MQIASSDTMSQTREILNIFYFDFLKIHLGTKIYLVTNSRENTIAWTVETGKCYTQFSMYWDFDCNTVLPELCVHEDWLKSTKLWEIEAHANSIRQKEEDGKQPSRYKSEYIINFINT